MTNKITMSLTKRSLKPEYMINETIISNITKAPRMAAIFTFLPDRNHAPKTTRTKPCILTSKLTSRKDIKDGTNPAQ